MRQTRCVRRACTGHVRRHLFFFYPYRPALRRLLLSLSSCRGRSRSKKRRRGARAREVRVRARSRVTILTVSRSCIGGATRENVVGGAGPGPSELSVCLSEKARRVLASLGESWRVLASLGSVVANMFRQAKRWGRRTLATPVRILAGCAGCHNATEPGLDVEPLAGARVRPVYRVLRACRCP